MLRIIASNIARALPDLLRDMLAFTAAGAIAYGAWLIYQPAGFIAGGALGLAGLYLQAKGANASDQGG